MVIAVIAMLVMQATIDKIIDVIAMGHRFVPASRAMHMVRVVTGTGLSMIAAVGVGLADFDDMLIDMIAMRMMKMTVMQVVDMVAVTNGSVPAILAMLMRVVPMDIAVVAHVRLLDDRRGQAIHLWHLSIYHAYPVARYSCRDAATPAVTRQAGCEA